MYLVESRPSLLVGGGADLQYRFTLDANVLWNSLLGGGYIAAHVNDTFPDKSAQITASAFNIGGDGKYDIALADKTLIATGGPVQFQYVWLAELSSTRLFGFWDFGEPQTVEDTQPLRLELNDANNRAISLVY